MAFFEADGRQPDTAQGKRGLASLAGTRRWLLKGQLAGIVWIVSKVPEQF